VESLHAYLLKQGLSCGLTQASARRDLGIVVVIPCHDEPDLPQTLASLRDCRQPRAAVEVLLILNASESDDSALRRRNRETMEQVRAWRAAYEDRRFRVHCHDFPRLPARHAGVGLARKIGMDEALTRFVSAGNSHGVIASLDADCVCDGDYLTSLESHFERDRKTRACTIYFEHALDGPLEKDLYRAITRYELYLRYYRHGLRYANIPYAHYTVGSCMAVRCDFYARHGGMNRRKAGEDFYFLNKLIAAGGVSENTATRVMPGVRASTRTPFGTGRALNDWMNEARGPWKSYDARVFRDLAALVSGLDALYAAPGAWRDEIPLSETMTEFLIEHGIAEKLLEIQANCASLRSFRKRFFQWFDALRVLKFIHHASRHAYPRQELECACRKLLRWQGAADELQSASARELLLYFRDRDRSRHGPGDHS